MLLTKPKSARLTCEPLQAPLPPLQPPPTQAEFDGAFLRLLERYGGLCWDNLTEVELDYLVPLAYDTPHWTRCDQEVLRDHALAKGIDMGEDVWLPNAPVLYMARLLVKLGAVRE